MTTLTHRQAVARAFLKVAMSDGRLTVLTTAPADWPPGAACTYEAQVAVHAFARLCLLADPPSRPMRCW